MFINENMLVGAIGIISLAIGYFTYFLSKYLENVKIQTIIMREKRERMLYENATKDLDNIILKIVQMTEQVIVKALKENSSDGKLKYNDIEKINNNTFNYVLENLSEENKNILKEHIRDIDTYIKNSIEAKVYEMKNK